jgi:radical SAM-linked protein
MPQLRLRFSRGEELKFISHLDIIRLWQRAFIRAGIPLSYSEGFNPHPRISLAAPLPVGVTSEAELMDVSLTRLVSANFFITTVNRQLPPGIIVEQALPLNVEMPSLQSQVRFAEYHAVVATEKSASEITALVAALLAKEELPWQHQRAAELRHYDLRALIDNVWLITLSGGTCTLGMRLRCDSTGSGRPEQVSAALGLDHPLSIHRTGFVMAVSQGKEIGQQRS